MKPNELKFKTWLRGGVLLSSMYILITSGCASSSGGGSSATVTSVPVPTTTTTSTAGSGMSYSSGATVAFVPDSMTVMNSYVAIHPLNAPTAFELNVALVNNGTTTIGMSGTVQISYYDNGQYYNSYLTADTNTVQVSDGYNGDSDSAFNNWFVYQGKTVFHGFFEDQYGAIVLVLDTPNATNGDGAAAQTYSGSVYFKNFGAQNCANPPPLAYGCGQQMACWFIEGGPYDCRAFLNSSGRVVTNSALYPANGYTRLGTFSGLNISQAFSN